MKRIIGLVALLFMILMSTFQVTTYATAAENPPSLEKIYQDGIKEESIPSNLSFEEWRNLGVSTENPLLNTQPKFTIFSLNARSLTSFQVKKGDMLITDGTSFGGLSGHAAIATTTYWVLDAPGYKINGLNTTRQKPFSDWVKEYSVDRGGRIWVYRLTNSTIASMAADWADRHYYSSIGSATQDKFPSYNIVSSLYTTDTVYCSKLVWQAYWYGSGSLPVMKNPSSAYQLILPYDMGTYFTDAYKPELGVVAN